MKSGCSRIWRWSGISVFGPSISSSDEGAQHALPRQLAILVPDDELRDHRVVEARDRRALRDAGVDPHAGPGRLPVPGDRARRRHEPVGRVLRVYAALDRVAGEPHVGLRPAQRPAACDPDLLADEVEPGHHLGHRVLHLEPGVHLEEVVGAVGVEQALDRARVRVPDRPGGVDGDRADALAQLGRDGGRRRLLEDLLVAALDGAVALTEVDHVAVQIGEHLHLDVAGPLEVALQVDGVVGKVRLALALGRLERAVELVRPGRGLDPLAPASGSGLHDDRVADLRGRGARLVERRDRLGHAGHDRDAGGGHHLPGGGLGRHRLHRVRRGADECQARRGARPRERRVLGEEAEAGVDRLGARPLGGADDRLAAEVALGGRSGADRIRLVGVLDERQLAVSLRIDGDRGDPHLAQRPADAHGDLAPVCNEHLGEHAAILRGQVPHRIRHGSVTADGAVPDPGFAGGSRPRLDQAERLQRAADRLLLLGRRLRRDVDLLAAHSGMLPCFRRGGSVRFPALASSAVMRTGRVRRGAITSST